MANVKISFSPPIRTADEVTNLSGGVECIDGYSDPVDAQSFAFRRRGGLWPWWFTNSTLGADGSFWWSDKKVLVEVVEGRVYAFWNPTDAPTEITSGIALLYFNVRVSFASDGKYLYMTNGNMPIYWDGTKTGKCKYVPEAPKIRTLAFLKSYIVGNLVDLNQIRWIEPEPIRGAGVEPKFGLSSFTPEGNPDIVSAIAVGFNELLAWGEKSLEFFITTDAVDVPFYPKGGAYVEMGVGAIDSIINFNNVWYWLNSDKKFVVMDNYVPKTISLPFDQPFRQLKDYRDAKSFVVDQRFIVLTFQTADFTFVYDTYTQGWAKWCWWNTETAQYERFLGISSAFVPDWNLQFVGSRKDGRVLIYHPNLVTDIGGPIRGLYRTAHLDHGTLKRKMCSEILLRLKRGA